MIGEWYFRVRSRAFGILKNFEVCRACVGPFRTETRLQFHSSLSRRPPLRPTLAPAPFFTIVTISFAQITALLSQRSTTHTEHALTTCVQNASQCVHAHTTITTCVNLSSCTSVKARAHAAGLSRAGRRASTCFLSRCVALEGAGLCRAGGSSHSKGVGLEGCSEGVGLEDCSEGVGLEGCSEGVGLEDGDEAAQVRLHCALPRTVRLSLGSPGPRHRHGGGGGGGGGGVRTA